jgi:hypothetical protein
MHDIAIALCGLVVVVSTIGGVRALFRRDPWGRVTSAYQFALAGMLTSVLVAQTLHSASLDLLGVAGALAFGAFSLYVWSVRKRSTTGA